MSDERVDTSDCLAHLEEFLDTLVALPHDTQRLLSLLKEQDACASSLHDELVVNITAAGLLPTGKVSISEQLKDFFSNKLIFIKALFLATKNGVNIELGLSCGKKVSTISETIEYDTHGSKNLQN